MSVPGANAGIGVIPLDGMRLRHIESDPTSTHYGELMSAPLDMSLSMPTTGLYLVGAYVGRSYTGPDANGAVLRGWVRLTTGNTHVAGVDWTPVYDYNTSNDLTALPVVGASNGIVTSVVVNPLPGAFQFAISDPWPGVAIDAPGSGGTQATAHVPTLLPEIPGTIDTTTMGSDHNVGLVPLIAAQGLSYVVGETLTATGGTFTTPFQGTVDSIGSAGGVQRFIVTQGGKYSAFPPDPTNFSGTAGAGFALHLQTWALGAPLIVDDGGFYPNGTPNAVLTQTNGDRGGRVTVKMGQSFVGSPTGLMLAGNATAPLQAVPLQQLTSAVAVAGPGPATTPPAMAGTAAVGISALFARGDHVHPSDTSRLSLATGGTVVGATTFNANTTFGGAGNNVLTIAPGATTAATTFLNSLGNIALNPPSVDGSLINFGAGAGALGVLAVATFHTGANSTNDGATGNRFTVNNILQSAFFRTPGTTYTGSGGAMPSIALFQANYTGAFSGNNNAVLTASVSSDTCTTGNQQRGLEVLHNFGGGATAGSRAAASIQLTQTGVATTQGGQYGPLNCWFQSSFSSGGTGAGVLAGGFAYGMNPQVLLLPGATNFALANALGEADIAVVGTTQSCTVAGSVTAGDTVSLTFANAAISGSPVTVSYTTGTGQTIPMLANNVQAAIWSNAALRAAGVSATLVANSGNLTLCWPYPLGTVTVTKAVSGAATETVTLGSVVSGASADQKYGMSIVRLAQDTGPAMTDSTAFWIADQATSPAAGWLSVIKIGGGLGQWPLAPAATIIRANASSGLGGNSRQQPLASPFVTGGIDFSAVNFTRQSGTALKMPGFSLDGTGTAFLWLGKDRQGGERLGD